MPEIALLTLANHVEVQNGLLYMNGGGWDTLTRTYTEEREPDANLISIALATLVHWDEANEKHQLTIWVEDEDGGRTGPLCDWCDAWSVCPAWH